MSNSLLIQLAYDSMLEVIQGRRIINKIELLKKYPLLNEKLKTVLNIYVDDKLKNSFCSQKAEKTLIEEIIYNAKRAAFEDTASKPLTLSEYLRCEVEIILYTPDGVISQKSSKSN